MRSDLYASFLGAYGENNDLFERLLLEFLRDHVFWRRNFHPEDPPPIPTFAEQEPEYKEFVARMRRELHSLSAQLKHSVPWSSPRYIGHMASDLLLPGLIAQMLTLPYNPNNVVEEAAGATVDMELSAGLQLARMFGYNSDEQSPDCAFGHLTSGGTVANYEALWLLRALRFYPVAVAAALRDSGHRLEAAAVDGAAIVELDDWQLANLPVDRIVEVMTGVQHELQALTDRATAARLGRAIHDARIENCGMVDFFSRHDDLDAPVLIVPVTAHYSWAKAMKLLGLGQQRLIAVGEQRMRMDAEQLDDVLQDALDKRQPVLGVVGVLGTTEFGTMDPIDRIVAARERWAREGLGFGVHVDAAWGGYLAAMFRRADASLRPRHRVRREFRHFPSREVYGAFSELHRADSITVDPHKLGYVPFGAGAFVCRDHRMMLLTAQRADYVFDPDAQPDSFRELFRDLGRFIIEGSKPGASAAAVYVAHRTLPLDHEHFGRLQAETVRATEYFFDHAGELAGRLADVATLTVPFEPDSNLICLAINPKGNSALARMNRFGRALYAKLRVDPSEPLQLKQFFGSSTTVSRAALGEREATRVCNELGIDPQTLVDEIANSDIEAEGVFMLRHTLMNPWLRDEINGINYIDRYCEHLEGLVREVLAAAEH